MYILKIKVKILNKHEISVKRIYLKNNDFEFFCVTLRIEYLTYLTGAFFKFNF